MYFKIFLYAIAAFTVIGVCYLLYLFYNDNIHPQIKRIFKIYDEDDLLSEDEKYKRYKKKKHLELINQQLLIREQDTSLEEYKSEYHIIGFIKPIGRWTQMVMNEQLQKFSGLKPEKRNGFWQMLVSLQGMSQGKYRGRGR